MSLAYDEYLAEHIGNVNKGLHWMLDNLPLTQEEKSAVETAMIEFCHDESKYSIEEYDPYDQYFYGGNRSHKVVKDFDYAWLHHIHNNPHHWQYWVLLEDDPDIGVPFKALRIPLNYIFEMIADWWSFSWKTGKLFEIFDWYDTHKANQIIHPESRNILEDILKRIATALEYLAILDGEDTETIARKYRKPWMDQDKTLQHSDASNAEDDEDLYGVPELKKFPMPDKKHVKSAIRFFNYIDPKHEKELADAILEKAKEFDLDFGKDISVGEENRFHKYLSDDHRKPITFSQ